MIRYIAVSVYGALVFTLGLLLSIVRPFHHDTNWTISQILGPGGYFLMGVKFKVYNRELIEQVKPAVIVCNHQNNLDMFYGAMLCPHRMAILGKTSIIFVPFFGLYFWLAGNLFIDKKNSRKSKDTMKQVTEKIKEKRLSVWVMPEGTRSRGRGLLPFKRGAFITAIDAGVPILPLVVSDTETGIDLSRFKAGHVIAKALPAISTEGMTRADSKELAERVHALMKAEIEILNREVASLKS
jgi:1-acyl-sn-glycerol-3-phosphate acyltransferase